MDDHPYCGRSMGEHGMPRGQGTRSRRGGTARRDHCGHHRHDGRTTKRTSSHDRKDVATTTARRTAQQHCSMRGHNDGLDGRASTNDDRNTQKDGGRHRTPPGDHPTGRRQDAIPCRCGDTCARRDDASTRQGSGGRTRQGDGRGGRRRRKDGRAKGKGDMGKKGGRAKTLDDPPTTDDRGRDRSRTPATEGWRKGDRHPCSGFEAESPNKSHSASAGASPGTRATQRRHREKEKKSGAGEGDHNTNGPAESLEIHYDHRHQ